MISRLVSRCRPGDRESGQASMVTVAMFMMLFAAIAVSFTFVVISASRQALNDSLQSSAKIAAESGVEDAKRLIVYCYNKRQSGGGYSSADDKKLCSQVIGKLSDQLEGMGCDEILGKLDNPNYNNSFAVEDEGGRGHRVRVGNNGSNNNNENNEYYQCLKIATKTDNYQGMVNNLGKSIIVPLRVVDTQNQAAVIASLKIEWHRNVNGNDGDNPAEMNGAEGTGLPPANIWTKSNRPAVLRVERVGVPKGNFTLDQLADSDTALTLRPSVKKKVSNYRLGDYKPQYPFNDRNKIAPNSQYYDQHGNKIAPIAEAACKDNNGDYACSTSFIGEQLDTKTADYYLRINAIYRSTHFKITAYDQNGKPLYFDGVQPLVDVTGSSSDSFSRIQARLKPSFDKNADSTNWWPEYVIDTNGKVCKDIEVQYDKGEDRCQP